MSTLPPSGPEPAAQGQPAPAPLLPPDLTAALARFAGRRRLLVAVDFDGTLAPLRLDPSTSRSVPGGIEVLREAATLSGVAVAVVSGRDLESLAALTGIGDADRVLLIGSHGAQSSLAADLAGSLLDEQQALLLDALTSDLQSVAGDHPGARVETKPAAASLHTRGMPTDAGEAALAAARAVGARHAEVHTMSGHDVVELSVLSTNKGDAVRHLRETVRAEVVAYFGDDVTDERAFAALDWVKGDVRVRVGGGETLAEHHLAEPADVVRALEYLVETRRSQ